jgi:virginiamycin B lyase
MSRRVALAALVVALPLAARATEVEIKEYPIPKGIYAHDVWADPRPDGPIYISGQRGGVLGILDPKTGQVEQVKLGDGSAPHGVVMDKAGDVWLTDGGQNAMVRWNPASKRIDKFPLPAERGRVNLNTSIEGAGGLHWFTGQNGIYGRVDSKSGEVKVWDAPKGRGAYGIHATPDGVVYFVSLANSYLARVDAASGAATVLEPPTSGQGARRVWSDSKGVLWVSEWNAGKLGRFEPRANQWQEWKSPGDRPQVYAVYVDEEDRPWVSEWSQQVMMRFDPETQKFEMFKSSSMVANVRQIHGRKGEVWTPESAADKIVVYKFR